MKNKELCMHQNPYRLYLLMIEGCLRNFKPCNSLLSTANLLRGEKSSRKKRKILVTKLVDRSLFAPLKKTVSHNRLLGGIHNGGRTGEIVLITNIDSRKEGRLEKQRFAAKLSQIYHLILQNSEEIYCIVYAI